MNASQPVRTRGRAAPPARRAAPSPRARPGPLSVCALRPMCPRVGLAPSALDLVRERVKLLRSEVYYFSAPNIAYFTVYSTTRAHDSRITRAPQTSELSHRERPHASAQHAAATCSTPLLPLTTCGPAGSRPTVTSERATRLPHRKGGHTAASSRSGHSDHPAPLLPAPRQDPPTRLVRVAPAAHTRHLGLGLGL